MCRLCNALWLFRARVFQRGDSIVSSAKCDDRRADEGMSVDARPWQEALDARIVAAARAASKKTTTAESDRAQIMTFSP